MARADAAVDAAGYVVAGLCGELVMDAITAEAYVVEGVDPPRAAAAAVRSAGATSAACCPVRPRALGLARGHAGDRGHARLVRRRRRHRRGARHRLPPARLDADRLRRLARARATCRASRCSTSRRPACSSEARRSCGGATLDWLDELLGRDAADLHELPPGAGGLLALPYLAGERTPVNDPFASGAVLGLTYSTTRDELCRAFIDAVALSALDHADRLRACGVDPARWRVAGGATRNAALLHACCDALGRPLDVMPHAGAAIGPAALALRAAGVAWQPSPERTIEPDARAHCSLRRAARRLPQRLRRARADDACALAGSHLRRVMRDAFANLHADEP